MMKRWRSSHEREEELLRHQINNPVCNENVQATADRKIVKIAHSQKAVPERLTTFCREQYCSDLELSES